MGLGTSIEGVSYNIVYPVFGNSSKVISWEVIKACRSSYDPIPCSGVAAPVRSYNRFPGIKFRNIFFIDKNISYYCAMYTFIINNCVDIKK